MTGDIVTQASNLGAFAVLAWVIHYVFTKGLEKFTKALEDQRREFLEQIDKQRDISLEALKGYNLELKHMAEAVKESSSSMSESFNQLVIEVSRKQPPQKRRAMQ